MTAIVQEMLAFVAVGGAAAWLAVAWWRRRAGGNCDGCSPRTLSRRTMAGRAVDRGVRPSALRVLR